MSLPKEKIDQLADKVADGIVREAERQYKDLRQHEVTPNDAAEAVQLGFEKARTGQIRKD